MTDNASPIVGQWRIASMEMWDQEFVDAEVPGFVRFDADGGGEFHFGYIHGHMTCEYLQRDGRPAAEWSWRGNDEMHEASGRGWVRLGPDSEMSGKLFFDRGDASTFVALRAQPPNE